MHNREELRGKSSQAELKLPEQEAGGSDFYLVLGLIIKIYCNVDETDYDLLQCVDDADLKFNLGDAQFELFQSGRCYLQNISVWGSSF